MIEALKKAQKDIDERKNPPPGKPPPPPPNADRPLLDIIAELKMIKAMEVRLYNRTILWGKKEEQSKDPDVVKELKDLAGRQLKIKKITHDLALGKNK
jgi:hypothetical protein